MADENAKTSEIKKPLTYEERILEAALKSMEKRTGEVAVAKLESGEPMRDILRGLMNSLQQGGSTEELEAGMEALATTPQAVPGSRIGGGQAFANLFAGKGFNPEAPVMEAMGMEEAVKQTGSLANVLEKQAGLQKTPGELTKLDLENLQKLLDIHSKTPKGVYAEAKNKAEAARMVEEEKSKRLTEENVRRAQSKLQLTYKKFGQVVNKTKELTKDIVAGGLEPGRLSGIATSLFSATGQNPYVKGFQGQLIETSIDLAKIAAPSSRPGPEFARMMAQTLPKTWYNLEEAKGTVVTSMTNTFANYAATHPEEFPEGFDMDTYEWELTNMFNQLENIQKGDKVSTEKADKTKTIGGKVLKTTSGVPFKYKPME